MNRDTRSCHLFTESTLHTSFLVSLWRDWCGNCGLEPHIYIRDHQPNSEQQSLRQQFHHQHAGSRTLTQDQLELLQGIYPEVTDTEVAMIRLFGLPAMSAYGDDVHYLGADLNGSSAKEWLIALKQGRTSPFIFTFLDQIFDSWWLEHTEQQIINAHSAILPFARGNHSIEQVACLGDIERLQQAAGGTVHYIDVGVDTGPIIRIRRLANPLGYRSIWELKGHTLMTAFELLIEVANDIATQEESLPGAVAPDPKNLGPNFKAQDFSVARQRLAQQHYLDMQLNQGHD